jgi:tetratricopeptide (TPR) repeat protein
VELSMNKTFQGRLDEAYDWGRRALELCERHALTLRHASLLVYLGTVRLEQGQIAAAEELATRAQAEMRRGGAHHYHAPTLQRLQAELAFLLGRADEARALLRLACGQAPPLAGDVAARLCLWSLAARAEHGRPAGAPMRPAHAAVRDRLGAPPTPLPDDGRLQREIDQLLA